MLNENKKEKINVGKEWGVWYSREFEITEFEIADSKWLKT